MFTGIEHFAIASANPKRLAEWYVANLEFEIVHESGGNYFVEAGNGAIIEIIPSEGERPAGAIKTPGIRHIAISVENFEDGYQQLQKKNIAFLGEPYETQGNRLVFFADPDGNVIHLIHRSNPLK